MQEPKTKTELIELSQNNYKKLIDLVNSYSKEEIEREFPEGTLNRNVRDVLAHLHHWHLMLLDWYKIGMNGEKPDMPSKGYTWKTLPGLNKKIWKEYQNVELEPVKEFLDISFANVQKIISNHTNEEIYEKNKYKWTGTTSLGGYLISNTSSHYDWAIKLVKKSLNWK
ncbi:MAG: hypothetical protein ACI8X3_000092 [Saprospiraceae bacterium]|jgi:hypothetical protein